MRIVTITSFVAEMPGNNTPVFLILDVSFVYSTSTLKISSWTNTLVSRIFKRNNLSNIRVVTRQVTTNLVRSTTNLTLPFIITYEIIPKLLWQLLVELLFFFSLGEDKISLRLFSILYSELYEVIDLTSFTLSCFSCFFLATALILFLTNEIKYEIVV